MTYPQDRFSKLDLPAMIGIGEPEHPERFTRCRTPKPSLRFFPTLDRESCPQQPLIPDLETRFPSNRWRGSGPESICLPAV